MGGLEKQEMNLYFHLESIYYLINIMSESDKPEVAIKEQEHD